MKYEITIGKTAEYNEIKFSVDFWDGSDALKDLIETNIRITKRIREHHMNNRGKTDNERKEKN